MFESLTQSIWLPSWLFHNESHQLITSVPAHRAFSALFFNVDWWPRIIRCSRKASNTKERSNILTEKKKLRYSDRLGYGLIFPLPFIYWIPLTAIPAPVLINGFLPLFFLWPSSHLVPLLGVPALFLCPRQPWYPTQYLFLPSLMVFPALIPSHSKVTSHQCTQLSACRFSLVPSPPVVSDLPICLPACESLDFPLPCSAHLL